MYVYIYISSFVRLAGLEASFNAAVEKKDGLEKKEAGCKIQLSNAAKLIGRYACICICIHVFMCL
jgi:hypothetical protein